MRLGLVGLGRMGGPMARRLVDAGHDVVGCDVAPDAVDRARRAGVEAVGALPALVEALQAPRVVWVMLPAGITTGRVLDQLAELLSPGDLVVDGGNSDWRDAGPRSERLAAGGIRFLDVGVSGGQCGWRYGYGLSVGGAPADFERLRPVLEALAAPYAAARVGPVGAGHFVKAVHNGVEYALLQAYAEGFALLCAHQDLDAVTVMRVWQAGCSVRSFLLEQTVAALAGNPTLEGVGMVMADSGMGRWTAEEAIRLAVATPVLTAALQARFASRDDTQPANRLLVAARARIGGRRSHA
jgi:6-phosphogluconate dehydrogenase